MWNKGFILLIAPIPAAIVFETLSTWVFQERFSSTNTGTFLIGAPFIDGDGIWNK